MKKAIITTAMAYLATCAISMATVQIKWESTGQDIKDVAGGNAPTTYYAQLIWSPDNVASPVDPANPLMPTEGELVAAEKALDFDGAILNTGNILGPDTYAGGYVYTRVFDSAAPMIGSLYGQGEASGNSAPGLGPGLEIETLNAATVTGNAHNPGSIIVDQVIVPEPSTLALLAVGLGTVLFRRRR